MPETILPNGPAPSPELPISVHLDGNIEAVDFIRRLARGGLELRQGSDDDYAVIVLADGVPTDDALPVLVHRRMEVERRRLNKASAVLTGAVLVAEHGVDPEIVADAISAARELVDAAIVALDSVNLKQLSTTTSGGST